MKRIFAALVSLAALCALAGACAVEPVPEDDLELIAEVRQQLGGKKCMSGDDCSGNTSCDTSSCPSCCPPNQICIAVCCGVCRPGGSDDSVSLEE